MGRCYNSAVIPAPRNAVWDRIKDFHDLSWAAGVIDKVAPIGAKAGTEVGAARVLNDAFRETLRSLDEDNFTFSYSIDDGPGPVARDAVSNYLGTVRLLPVSDSNATFIEWVSRFDAAANEDVEAFCNPIYAALIGALKAGFE